MIVLVTGAGGRVGATLVRRLALDGWEVRGLVKKGGSPAPSSITNLKGVSFVEGDLRDQESLEKACGGVTHVVHLAAQLVRGNGPAERFFDINSLGTFRLLECLTKIGNLEYFVLASSDGTYRPGAPPSVPLGEEALQEPGDYYGTSKLLSEVILRNHAVQYEINYSILRFASVISPKEAVEMFRVPFWRAFLAWQKEGRSSHLWPLFDGQPDMGEIFAAATRGIKDCDAVGLTGPNGEPWTMSMVDVRDAVEGICLALTERAAIGRTFNIAAELPTSHHDATSAIAERLHVDKVMVPMPVNHRLEINIDAAERYLGYKPKHQFSSTFEAGLKGDTSDYIPIKSSTGVGSVASSIGRKAT